MSLRINLWTRAPLRMDTKVSIIAWMDGWLNIKRAEGCFGGAGWKEIDGGWQTNGWTDRRRVSESVLAVTNRRAGQARGRERRLYSPGETGLILTYAPEWNVDWHDLLIWAVTAHDGHRHSPVMLFQAWRTSCHQDRSKIEIHFLLGVDLNEPPAQTSICHPTCYCCTCSAVVIICIALLSRFSVFL